ncbi:hypothetical protein F5882DRAFT_450790 [Hyaloscypha sp. PMI_1271]|nr:hypothetical protein F5882DRAFT_450790 [Hyaloscypha sp. PMI_1271]
MALFIGLAIIAHSSGINSMVEGFGVSTGLRQFGKCADSDILGYSCELVDRTVIYVVAHACFVIVFIELALGKDIANILVMRVFSDLFGYVGTTLVSGNSSELGPMACFPYVVNLGTVAAPIYVEFIDETIDWRGDMTLHKRAKALRNATGDKRYKAEMDLEAKNIKEMLQHSSIKARAPIELSNYEVLIPIIFQQKRGWREGAAGLPHISFCIGVTIEFAASFSQIRGCKVIMKSRDRKILPESRFFTFGCYGETSSAIVSPSLMRNTLGGTVATQFFQNIGSQYLGLILVIAGTLLTLVPFVVFKYGHILRQRSKFASSQLGGDEQKDKTGNSDGENQGDNPWLS